MKILLITYAYLSLMPYFISTHQKLVMAKCWSSAYQVLVKCWSSAYQVLIKCCS